MSFEDSQPGISVSEIGKSRSERSVDLVRYRTALVKLTPIINKLGYDGLRPGQDRAILNMLMGKDTLCFIPTGFGKSAIYIISALALEYRCLIFSPLVSLMKDQVESLWRMDLSAAQISGGQTKMENDMAMRSWECGELQFLLVAPERMSSDEFMSVMNRQKPEIVAVDEAHCLSSWGDSFRPSYLQIGNFIDMCNPELVLALTATATSGVEADIRKVLRVDKADKIVYYPSRKNLILTSQALGGKYDVKRLLDKMDGPTIVYCPTQKLCEALYAEFGDAIEGGSLVYHGGLDDGTRTTHQELFMRDEMRVMFATNAFGMGVDKSNIRGIIHCGYSKSVDSYTQEAGRAGRDGRESKCVLLYDDVSYKTQTYLIDMAYPSRHVIELVMEKLLQKMDARTATVHLTGVQIAAELGLDERAGQVSSALAILARFGAVERSREQENLSRVRILKDNPDREGMSCLDLIKNIGVQAPDGYYDFAMSMFVTQSKWKEKKAKDMLTVMDRNGFVHYTRPFKGKTTKILKGIKAVDFEGLNARREEEVKKLDVLRDYTQVADASKHKFLLDYFGIK